MQNFHHTGICPIRDILGPLGSKWSLLVLTALQTNGTMRFVEIQKSLGDISQRMLTVTLRSLENDGLITRKVYPQVPPRVEYRLTPRGTSLMPHLNGLVNWALENMSPILENRGENGYEKGYEKDHENGHENRHKNGHEKGYEKGCENRHEESDENHYGNRYEKGEDNKHGNEPENKRIK